MNPITHSRMKHVQIDYHFVRERVDHGTLKITYINRHQLAVLFTKSQVAAKHKDLSVKLSLTDSPTFSLRKVGDK